MNPQDWQKIKEAFNEAVELSSSERAGFLRSRLSDDSEARREVEKMLSFADSPDDTLEKNAFEVVASGGHATVPERIGDYKILREIGRGGMGAVYEAVRENQNFKQRVAIKVIKRGMDTDAVVPRFRVEQKILASLEHPNIARFLDGGMTDGGLPFYAMEYVEGASIDDYCAAKNLSLDERLKLFRDVCTAVQYAHQNLVVHRDLKPKNILVTTDGAPKLLDFGIGKILAADAAEEAGTATQLGMMTPAYASPEQIRGDQIGTASDIYSLGVILYELLTGQNPYKFSSKSQFEIERAVLESEPVPPSSVQNSKFKVQNSKSERLNPKSERSNPKSLKGDLDTIILKAMRKEIAERYVSVGQFSEDIRRYLEGVPIFARPSTFAYRATKFIKRNRVGVLTATLIFLALCGGIAIAVWQAFEARAAERRAENRFEEVRELANNVIFKYHDAIADLPGSTATREMLVRDATRYLDNLAAESADNHELQRELAKAYVKLGDVQGKAYAANIGDTAGAMESYRKAVALLEAVVTAKRENRGAKSELVGAYDALFALIMRTADDSEKYSVLEKSLKLQDELLAAAPDNAEYRMQKAQNLIRKGDITLDYLERSKIHQAALEIAEDLYQKDPQNLDKLKLIMRLNQRIGTAYIWFGDEAVKENGDAAKLYAAALPFHEKSSDLAQKLYALDNQNLYNARSFGAAATNLGETLARNGRQREALEKINIARGIFENTLAKDPRNIEAKFDVASCYSILAETHLSLGENPQAIEYFQKAIVLNKEIRQADKDNMEIVRAIQLQSEQLSKIYDELGDAKKSDFFKQQAENAPE